MRIGSLLQRTMTMSPTLSGTDPIDWVSRTDLRAGGDRSQGAGRPGDARPAGGEGGRVDVADLEAVGLDEVVGRGAPAGVAQDRGRGRSRGARPEVALAVAHDDRLRVQVGAGRVEDAGPARVGGRLDRRAVELVGEAAGRGEGALGVGERRVARRERAGATVPDRAEVGDDRVAGRPGGGDRRRGARAEAGRRCRQGRGARGQRAGEHAGRRESAGGDEEVATAQRRGHGGTSNPLVRPSDLLRRRFT